jgi:hypothetical protein
MSYNIDNWKTKKLENLTIPLKAFFDSVRTDWHPNQPVIVNTETMEIEMEGGCEQLIIKGNLKDEIIYIAELKLYGEGSGSFKSFILDEVLKQSKGELEAILIWESGDSITRLKVKDGVIEETNVELFI